MGRTFLLTGQVRAVGASSPSWCLRIHEAPPRICAGSHRTTCGYTPVSLWIFASLVYSRTTYLLGSIGHSSGVACSRIPTWRTSPLTTLDPSGPHSGSSNITTKSLASSPSMPPDLQAAVTTVRSSQDRLPWPFCAISTLPAHIVKGTCSQNYSHMPSVAFSLPRTGFGTSTLATCLWQIMSHARCIRQGFGLRGLWG
jgi:hypothetical protein